MINNIRNSQYQDIRARSSHMGEHSEWLAIYYQDDLRTVSFHSLIDIKSAAGNAHF